MILRELGRAARFVAAVIATAAPYGAERAGDALRIAADILFVALPERAVMAWAALRAVARPVWRRIPGTTRGSKRRNFWSLAVALTCLLIVLDWAAHGRADSFFHARLSAYGLVLASAGFFYETVLAVGWLTSSRFKINPRRLIRDIFLSGFFMILSFALIYRRIGLEGPSDWCGSDRLGDYVYFSVVTFSTVGYGDFHPVTEARGWAAAQAVLGNLHLGLLVGAIYLYIDFYGKMENATRRFDVKTQAVKRQTARRSSRARRLAQIRLAGRRARRTDASIS